MNKRQRKKQLERNRYQLWLDGCLEGMFVNRAKARRFMQANYGAPDQRWDKSEYDIIDAFFRQEDMSGKPQQVIICDDSDP